MNPTQPPPTHTHTPAEESPLTRRPHQGPRRLCLSPSRHTRMGPHATPPSSWMQRSCPLSKSPKQQRRGPPQQSPDDIIQTALREDTRLRKFQQNILTQHVALMFALFAFHTAPKSRPPHHEICTFVSLFIVPRSFRANRTSWCKHYCQPKLHPRAAELHNNFF